MTHSANSEAMKFHCQPKSWFSWSYSVIGNGRQADIVMKSMSESGSLTVDGESFAITKEGWLKGHWVLQQAGQAVATARKTSPFSRSVEVCVGDQTLLLEPEAVFRRSYRLRKNDIPLARIYPASWASRKAVIETYHADTSVALSCFAFWIVLLLWRRAASSS